MKQNAFMMIELIFSVAFISFALLLIYRLDTATSSLDALELQDSFSSILLSGPSSTKSASINIKDNISPYLSSTVEVKKLELEHIDFTFVLYRL